jgi:hypothetical protein
MLSPVHLLTRAWSFDWGIASRIVAHVSAGGIQAAKLAHAQGFDPVRQISFPSKSSHFAIVLRVLLRGDVASWDFARCGMIVTRALCRAALSFLLFVDAIFLLENSVDGFGCRVRYVGFDSGLADRNLVLVDESYELMAPVVVHRVVLVLLDHLMSSCYF